MLNKKGIIGSFISLFIATMVIAMILIAFIVVSGIVKAIERGNTGEKIYESDEVGVGDVRYYMNNYGRLVSVEKSVNEGELVEDALTSADYKSILVDVQIEQIKSMHITNVWGVFYG